MAHGPWHHEADVGRVVVATRPTKNQNIVQDHGHAVVVRPMPRGIGGRAERQGVRPGGAETLLPDERKFVPLRRAHRSRAASEQALQPTWKQAWGAQETTAINVLGRMRLLTLLPVKAIQESPNLHPPIAVAWISTMFLAPPPAGRGGEAWRRVHGPPSSDERRP